MNPLIKKIGLALIILLLLTPVGIILPKWLHAGDAWGEWPAAKVKKELGYVPEGMQKTSGIWKAPLPGYSTGKDNNSVLSGSVYYIMSAFAGIGIITIATWSLVKIYKKNE